MTYVYETTMGGKHLVVEYCFSSVSDSIKVVDMTADGNFHRLNWMSDAGRDKLMTALDKDMEDRMCGTLDDVSVGGDFVDTEMDLDRDIPGFEGTMDELDHLVGIGAV